MLKLWDTVDKVLLLLGGRHDRLWCKVVGGVMGVNLILILLGLLFPHLLNQEYTQL